METKLYVGNLPYSVTELDLRNLFAQAGEVVSADVIMDRASGRSKGFGFVVMSSQADLEKAIQMFNGYNIDNRALTVNIARPREERPAGGGYGGGGGGGYGGGRGGYGGGGRSQGGNRGGSQGGSRRY